jgi:hypothetical protein
VINIDAFPEHKRASGRDGYLYVIQLSTDVVKVGKTRNPRQRIANHIDTAGRFGASVKQVWLSEMHENYSENEQLLITALGVPAHGNEFFRVDFSEAVRLAAGFDYVCPTTEQREIRDARLSAQARASAQNLFQALDGGDFVRIKILADEAGPLQLLYGDALPEGFSSSSDEGDDTLMDSLIQDVVDKTGIPFEEIESWSYIDVIEHIAKTSIHVQRLRLETRALIAGRTDLTSPAFVRRFA